MKHITKLVEKEVEKLNSKIDRVKKNGRIAFANGDYNAWGEYDRIEDKLSYRRLCLKQELKSLNKIQEEK